MDVSRDLELFRKLILCSDGVWSWRYDAQGNLLSSDCPQEALFATAFSMLGCKEQMLAGAAKADVPVTLGTSVGLIWGAAFEREDGAVRCIHLVGPVFYTELSPSAVEQGLVHSGNLSLSVAWTKRFLEELRSVPTVPHIVFSRYLLMLHFCLTGETLRVSDLVTIDAPQPAAAPQPQHDRYQVYSFEQAMLQMVRNGDLNYGEAFSNSAMVSNGVPVQGSDPLRQSKISNIVFCSLVCRAAIEGGLSPEEAYSLGDTYIQASESARSYDEVSAIAGTMYDDFIRRVHKRRTNPTFSPAIQRCVDYIEMHLGERIRAADLAALVGYTEYYLTHKFKEETHYFVSDYVKFAKIERAKVLLRGTDRSLQEIADALGFSTRSYFSRCFRQVAGCAPAEYRAKNNL